MTRDELLTELAMSLEEWPVRWDGGLRDLFPEIGAWNLKSCPPFLHGINAGAIRPSDWNQRRRELINEPDDADAPEWARFKAQDGDGRWFWYESAPQWGLEEGDVWTVIKGAFKPASSGKIPAGHEWRETLKPVERELPAPEWDGEGLPPVGCKCEFVNKYNEHGVYTGEEVDILCHYHPNSDIPELQVAVFSVMRIGGRTVDQATHECFRPIRTPEQRAEDEAVDEMVEALRDFPRKKQEGRSKGVCRRLYRAGYRKQGSSNE